MANPIFVSSDREQLSGFSSLLYSQYYCCQYQDPLHIAIFICRLNVRPGVGGIRSHVGVQQSFLSQPARTATFQQRFDARQKIGLSDARLKLGVKDAREKLLQKDARFRIKGKVQDAREMLNSRKQQATVPPKPHQVTDAREKLSLKRSAPAAFMNPPVGTVTPALKLTKTIQVCVALVMSSWKPVITRFWQGAGVGSIGAK